MKRIRSPSPRKGMDQWKIDLVSADYRLRRPIELLEYAHTHLLPVDQYPKGAFWDIRSGKMDLLFQPDYSDIRDEFRIGERMAQKYFKKFVELGYWEIMAQGGRHGKTIYKVGRGVRIPRQEEGEKRRPLYNKVFGFKKSNSHLLHTTYSI